MSIESKLNELNIILPQIAKPLGSYIPARKAGDLVFVSGQLPKKDNELITGKVGFDLSIEQGKKACETAFINALGVIKSEIKDLDKIDYFVKLTGYINSSTGFINQADVMNGASDLAVKIFGENGKHARVAIGVSELPLNAACEIEVIVQLKN